MALSLGSYEHCDLETTQLYRTFLMDPGQCRALSLRHYPQAEHRRVDDAGPAHEARYPARALKNSRLPPRRDIHVFRGQDTRRQGG